MKQTLAAHDTEVHFVTFSPDGGTLASGSRHDGALKLWDLTGGRLITTIQQERVNGACFSPDGQLLAFGSESGLVKLWDVAKQQERHTLKGHTAWIGGISFSADGQTLCTASAGASDPVRFWDVASGEELQSWTWGATPRTAFSPDGKFLAAGSWDGKLRLLDLATGQVRLVRESHKGEVVSLCFRPDGGLLASSGKDGAVRLTDPVTARVREVIQIERLPGMDHEVAFSPDGRHLATFNGNGAVCILRLAAPAAAKHKPEAQARGARGATAFSAPRHCTRSLARMPGQPERFLPSRWRFGLVLAVFRPLSQRERKKRHFPFRLCRPHA